MTPVAFKNGNMPKRCPTWRPTLQTQLDKSPCRRWLPVWRSHATSRLGLQLQVLRLLAHAVEEE
eukprot:686520-Alexandrium_andersonii.AAC.1